jgi:histidine triad (HIT) family protein
MADYKSENEENKCIFCEIVKGNITTPGVFWEDEEFMAFLSKWPNTKGFTVVITKEHYGSDVLALPDDVLQRFIIATKKVSNILLKQFDDVGRIGLMMEGLGINHAHIKLMPMHGTEYLKKGEWKQTLSDKKDFFKEYPGYIISNDGPEADESELRNLAEKLREC